MVLFRRLGVSLFLITGLAFMSLTVAGLAQGPKKDAGKKEPVPASTINWHEKKIAFEMRGQPWGKVYEWLADQTGMPYASPYPPPPGTLTFINPKIDGKPREYTLAEVFDIINEISQGSTKHTLIRRETILTMYPADADIPDYVFPLVAWEDLEKHGKTEIVRTAVILKNQVAEDVAGQVKKALDEFGKVTPIADDNKLILRGTVASLLFIKNFVLSDNPDKDLGSVNTLVHQCQFIRAAAAKAILMESLGAQTSGIRVQAGTKDGGGVGDAGAPGAPGFPPTKGGNFGGGPTTQRFVRPHTISIDKNSNKVIVHGPIDKIRQAKDILKDIDKGKPGQIGLLVGPPEFKNFSLPAGGAETTSKILDTVYKDDPEIRIVVSGPSSIFVRADPQTLLEMGLLIHKEFQPAQLLTVFLPLIRLEPAACEATLKAMLKDGPFIEADKDSNGIRVRGTTEQISQVKEILKALDDSPFTGSGTSGSRTINLEKGSGATVAEALSLLLKRLRPGLDVEVILPGELEMQLQPKKEEPKKAEKKTTHLTPDKLREVMYVGGAQPVSFQDEIKPPPVKKGKITIQGFGNKMVITSDDPKALDEAQQLIRLLVNTEAGPGDFEVLPLKTANAVEVAKILDEAFNGPKNQQGGGGGRGGPGLSLPGIPGIMTSMMGLGSSGQTGRVENIRVVADGYTNALLIRAKPVDMLTIRRLIKNNLDLDNVNSEQVVKTHKLKLEYANAAHVADNVRQLYAQQMQPRTQQSPGGGGFGGSFAFGGGGSTQSSGTPNAVLLTVSVDDDRNTLLVHCPATLFKDIKRFVDDIEEAASKQSYAVVQPKDIDPALMQQLVNVMTGNNLPKRPGDTSNTSSAGMVPGAPGAFGTAGRGFGGGGFGTGVGGPGGFGGGGFPGGFGGGAPGGFGGGAPGGFGGGAPGGFGGGAPGGFGVGTPGGRTPGGGGGPPGGGGGGRPTGGGKGQQSRGPDFFVPPVMDDRSVSDLLQPQERGRDFFAQPVMDDRSASVFYDPSEEQDEPPQPRDPFARPGYTANPFSLAALMQEKDAGPKLDDRDGFRPPPFSLKIEVLANGQLLLRGDPKDIQEFLKTLEYLQKKSDGTKVEIRLVATRFQDPTTLTERLNEFYSKVAIDANGTQIVPRPTTGIGQAPAASPGGQGTTPIPTATPSLPPYNLVFLPQPRLGAILVAAPKARLQDVLDKIQMFDQPHAESISLVPIPLKRASAKDVAQAITAFFQSRWVGSNNPVNFSNVRVTADTVTNTLMVQAAPADLADIRRFVEHVDNDNQLLPKNELRVVFLRNAVALDLGNLLYQAIANGTLTVAPTSGLFQPAVTTIAAAGATTIGGTVVPTIPMTKDSRLKFVPSGLKDGKPSEAGILEDIRFQSDVRTNSLIVIAPEKTMPLLLALIRELDVPPQATSRINVFQMKRSDSTQIAIMLQQLFLGTGQIGTKTGAAGGGAALGGGAAGAAGANRPLTFTISGTTPEGAPIIDLRVTVDERTNSLIAAGSQNDLLTIGSIIAKLEDADVPRRINDTIKLRNANAVDVVNAVQTFYTNITTLLKVYNQATNSLGLMRDVLLTAEPISNCVMISATPELFDEVVRQIAKMDTTPPMVVVSCLIAEVDLSGTEEFGVELGLQNPLAFNRGLLPGTSTITYTTSAVGPTNGFAPTAIGPVSQSFGVPGFNFNNPLVGLGNNTSVSPTGMAQQALSSLGVGRTSSNVAGVSGLVLSSGNESINILIRALKVQERITILTRPQIMTLDNQAAVVQLVTYFPIVSGASTVTTGVVTAPPIVHTPLGVTLQVTPRITPDGRVLMRVIPEVSAIQSTSFPLGNGTVGTSYNVQHLETSVSAYDGDTILIGGLIQKKDDKAQNSVPVLGELPYVGWMFRFRTDIKSKTELVFIMTPHIVRNRTEAQQIMMEESRKIAWDLPEVTKIHGARNCEVFLPAENPQTIFAPPPQKGPNMLPAIDTVPARQQQPAAPTFFTPPTQTNMAPAQSMPQYVEAAPPARPGLWQKLFGARSEEPAVAQRVYVSPSQSPSGPAILPPLPTVYSGDSSSFINPAPASMPQTSPPPGPANYVMPAQTYYPPRGSN